MNAGWKAKQLPLSNRERKQEVQELDKQITAAFLLIKVHLLTITGKLYMSAMNMRIKTLGQDCNLMAICSGLACLKSGLLSPGFFRSSLAPVRM